LQGLNKQLIKQSNLNTMDRISKEKWEEIRGNGMDMVRTIIDSLVDRTMDSLAHPNDYSDEQIRVLDEELEKWMNIFDEERKKLEDARKRKKV